MTIYLIIFAFLVLSSFIEAIGEKKAAFLFLSLAMLGLIATTALREGIGTDFYSYKNIFIEITEHNIIAVELGFTLLNYFANYIGGFKVLLLIASVINISAMLFVLIKLRLNVSVGILTYYSLFYLNHNFNTIRHGMMATVVWVGIYFFFNKKLKKSITSFFVAMSFHQIALVLFPLQFLTRLKIGFLVSITALIAFYVFGILTEDMFAVINLFYSSDRLDYYQNDFYAEGITRYQFGIGFFLYIFIYFLVLKYYNLFANKNTLLFLNRVLFLAISVIVLFASVSIFVERIANVLLVSIVFIFASINFLQTKTLVKFTILCVIISIDFFYLYKILHLPGVDRVYQFIPYQFKFN